MFAGQSTTVTFDGLTPIAWATGTLSTNLVYGPAGADHQTTTRATDATGEGAGPGCGNGGTTPGCPANSADAGSGDAGAAVVSWLYLDRQGTVRATADSTGVTTSTAAYTDYGVLEPAAGTLYAGAGTEAAPGQEDRGTTPLLPITTTVTPIGYTGEQLNPAAGLNHYHARDYQPATTRWLQADPWAGDTTMPATLGKYTYVTGNPATFVDILGERLCIPELGAKCVPPRKTAVTTPKLSCTVFFTCTKTAWHPPMKPQSPFSPGKWRPPLSPNNLPGVGPSLGAPSPTT